MVLGVVPFSSAALSDRIVISGRLGVTRSS